MNKKKWIIIIILLVIGLFIGGLFLGGCFNSLTDDTDIQSSDTDQVGLVERVMATQTALAKAIEGHESQEPTEEPLIEPTAESTKEPNEDSLPVASIDLSVPETYTIHYGEHPFCLARRFNIDPDTLMVLNGLDQDYQAVPGDTLVIPQNAAPYEGDREFSTHPDSFVVLPLDTFYSIACYYGDIYPEEIAVANSMTIDKVLEVGTVIQIP